jgi:putative SOS response-associated peptidase YedK
MCGRFTLTAEAKEVAKRFGVEISGSFYKNLAPRYNIAPTQPVVVLADDGKRYLTQMRWWLVPSWAKDPAIGNRMINARAETLTTKPAFRVAIRKRRCLIVADGFYEWQRLGKVKQPVRIVLKSKELFGFPQSLSQTIRAA